MPDENTSPQRIWQLYCAGVNFKNEIGLYETVDKNERFFAGDQWAGVYAPDLPKPVVNFIKRASQQRVAEVNENPVGVCFESVEFPSDVALPQLQQDVLTDNDAELLNALFENDWERMKMDSLNLDGLLDACVSGDYILYNYWDSEAETGQAALGRICAEIIDNVNYYPGNPNECDVQKQPNIIIARRELVNNVVKQAKASGMADMEIELITSDSDCGLQSGDISHRELNDDENTKCLTLLYLFRGEDDNIWAQKTTRNAYVRPLWDTGLRRYPIAMMNWENRKNCCHGRAEVTGLIPVQRYINQMYAMAMLFTMQSACPKAVFNQSMVKAWSNAVGAAIPVNGDVSSAIKYLDPPALSSDVYSLPERLMNITLQMVGVPDMSLGTINPTNTSALALARESFLLPVESIKTRFYSMIEDFARNWLDMVTAYYTVPRWIKTKGNKTAVFDAEKLRGRLWNVKIDVGAANSWSEVNSVQILTSLYNSGAINAKQYIERLPDGYFPMRSQLIAEFEKDGNGQKQK